MSCDSVQGARYAMPITDEYSKFVTVYFLPRKEMAPDLILELIKFYEAQINAKVMAIQTDNAAELTSRYLRDQLKSKGIRLQTSIAYTPQQNGVAERMNRTLV